ncbi:SRPBCC family protein [Actinomadura sp. NPDC047616]|uniref:SRPBCC family protein n=1 Tax=Actinomadura sp. NPDC047616 TaxID=3155914 RepID=UPI0033FD9CAC
MEYEASRTMPADGRVVFDIAADTGTMHRWLPGEIDVHEIAPGVAEAEDHAYGVDREGVMRTSPEQFRLEWGSRGTPDYTGWLQVMDHPGGTSEVVVHLSFLGDQPEATGASRARDHAERELRHSLDRLAEEVARRVGQPGGG